VTRVGVVGHTEWVEFAVVPHVPRPGDIVHASSTFLEAGGGGAVAAVRLREEAGSAFFLTALGDDEAGARAERDLRERHGLELHVARRPEPQRRGFTHLDADAERTITVLGRRIVPHGDDDLPWALLDDADAVYFTGGDPDALRHARRARHLVATPRALDTLRAAHVQLDVLVASASDEGERVAPGELDPPPRHTVLTEGAAGGSWTGETSGRWEAVPLPGPAVDAYGAGDSFAAGLTLGLAQSGGDLGHALQLGARMGAEAMTRRGPYGR
jgi:ribokinase